MSQIDFIASQIPQIPDMIESVRTYWRCSRHPDNLRDIIESAKSEDITPSEKLRARAGAAAIALAGGPLNEALLTIGVGNTLQATHNIVPAVAAVAPITGSMELASGIGVAYIAERFPSAVNIIKERYINKKDNEEEAPSPNNRVVSPSSGKQIARTLGIVGLTGTGSAGATLDYELHDKIEEDGHKRNKRVAKIASGMLVGINMAYVGAILGTTKGVEKVGVSGATETVANITRNPLIVGGAIIAAIIGKKEYDIIKFKLKRTDETKTAQSVDGANASGVKRISRVKEPECL